MIKIKDMKTEDILRISKILYDLSELGVVLEEEYESCGYLIFSEKDKTVENAKWVIEIDEDEDDWIIHMDYHDPDHLKDWFGCEYQTGGSASYKVMKLILELIELKKGVRNEIVDKAKKYDKIMAYLAEMEDKNANVQTGSISEESVLASKEPDVRA